MFFDRNKGWEPVVTKKAYISVLPNYIYLSKEAMRVIGGKGIVYLNIVDKSIGIKGQKNRSSFDRSGRCGAKEFINEIMKNLSLTGPCRIYASKILENEILFSEVVYSET